MLASGKSSRLCQILCRHLLKVELCPSRVTNNRGGDFWAIIFHQRKCILKAKKITASTNLKSGILHQMTSTCFWLDVGLFLQSSFVFFIGTDSTETNKGLEKWIQGAEVTFRQIDIECLLFYHERLKSRCSLIFPPATLSHSAHGDDRKRFGLLGKRFMHSLC